MSQVGSAFQGELEAQLPMLRKIHCRGGGRQSSVYLVGIKGAGMAGLAVILKGLGYRVTGSDISDTFFTDDILKRKGIRHHEQFDATNIPRDTNWAISSGAYLTQDNVEITELKRKRIPILSYPEAVAYFFNQSFGIAVTGTHGKSTTTAMIAYILEQAGKDPFTLVGAELLNWASNARVPQQANKLKKLEARSYFVIEADEYREQFLHYKPNVIVITNIDYDHPDYFATKKDYQHVFEKFKGNLKPKGFVVQRTQSALPHIPYRLSLIGAHNQQNAAIAYETCKLLGVDDNTISNALLSFKGTRRRLEKIGEYHSALIIDDYAHHPAEVKASLSALKEAYPDKRLVALFHPHTYSRTKMFLKEFAQALTLADDVYLLDIYASARELEGDVSSDDIIQELALLGRTAKNLKNIENAVHYISARLKKGDLLVTMGAGDVFRVAHDLITP